MCALGVARNLFNLKGGQIPGTSSNYIPWQDMGNGLTIVNKTIKVQVIDIPLKWVKWCPVLPDPYPNKYVSDGMGGAMLVCADRV